MEVARLLVERGADAARGLRDGRGPLFVACQKGRLDVVRLLVQSKAGLCEAVAGDGTTPLHLARDPRIVRLLLDGGADIDRADAHGATALLAACQEGRVEVARLLVERGADVERGRDDGATPLIVACREGQAELVRLLAEKGAH